MSNAELDLLRRITRLERALENTRSVDIPGIRLPYAQRILNPFPLASSGNAPGDFPQSRALTILAFNVSVFVVGTNSGADYWTLQLYEDLTMTVVATVVTSAIGPGTWARLSAASLGQPAAGNIAFSLVATATGAPGAIHIVPEMIVA